VTQPNITVEVSAYLLKNKFSAKPVLEAARRGKEDENALVHYIL
jgi:hypothetical protein